MTERHEPESTFSRTARGAGWMVTWRVANRILGLLSILVLVRLLAPTDFGLIALAASFVAIVDTLAYIGVEDTLVRDKAPSRAMLDTAFTLNVLRAVASAALIAVLAEPAARFLDEPRLAPLILLLAAVTAVEGFVNIGTIAFRRDMAFEKEFQLQIMPRAVAVVVTLALAVAIQSHWALMAGILVHRLLRLGLSYAMHPYRPGFSLQAWRELAGFSAWSWAIMLAIQLRERSETLLIGHLLDTRHVGIYETGKEIALLPLTEFVEPACHAAYSGFAEARNSGRDPADACLRATGLLALLSLPAGFGLSLIAAPAVRLAFGPDWLDAVPVIQFLGIASALSGLGVAAGTLMRAHGLLRLTFKLTLTAAPVRIALLLIFIPIGGLFAAAAAVAAATVLGRFGSMFVAFRHFGISFSQLVRRIWRSATAVTAMTAALWLSGLGWTATPPDSLWACAGEITAAGALGIAIYLATVAGLWMASGRPSGPETDAAMIAQRALSRIFRRLRAA